MKAHLSFPLEVITSNVEPPSPHGCQSIFAMDAELLEAW